MTSIEREEKEKVKKKEKKQEEEERHGPIKRLSLVLVSVVPPVSLRAGP